MCDSFVEIVENNRTFSTMLEYFFYNAVENVCKTVETYDRESVVL